MSKQIDINATVIEIIALALQVQNQTPYAAFFDFYGHTKDLVIEVTKSKEDWSISIYKAKCKTSPNTAHSRLSILHKLNKIRNTLTRLLAETEK